MNTQGMNESDLMDSLLERRIMGEPVDCPACGSNSIGPLEDDEMDIVDESNWECYECGHEWTMEQ